MAQLETFTPGNEKYTTKKIGELVYVGTNSGGSLKIFVEPNKYLEIANTTWGSGGGGTSSGKYCTGYISTHSSTAGAQALGTYDTNDSAMTANAGKITITETGRYLVTVSGQVWTNGSGTSGVSVTVNTSNVLESFTTGAGAIEVVGNSKVMNLTAGQLVELNMNAITLYSYQTATFIQVQQL